MSGRSTSGWTTLALIAAVLTAPLTVFVGVFGQRFGWWGLDVALDLLTLTVAPWLLGAGAIASLFLLCRARRGGTVDWLLALFAVGIVAGGVMLYADHISGGDPDQLPPIDASTSPAEPPTFSTSLARLHQASPDATCSGVAAIPTQVRAEEATDALKRAGFTPLPSSLFRVEGTHTGLWFLMKHDATIRIRPGQTDVRVAARSNRPDGGETCRLLARIVEELQPRS